MVLLFQQILKLCHAKIEVIFLDERLPIHLLLLNLFMLVFITSLRLLPAKINHGLRHAAIPLIIWHVDSETRDHRCGSRTRRALLRPCSLILDLKVIVRHMP